MSYDGFFINLARSAERRAEVEEQLVRFGFSHLYRRFEAIDGAGLAGAGSGLSAGEAACFLSHTGAIGQNLAIPRHLHIVEDDVLFSRHTAEVIDRVTAGEDFARYDILFADIGLTVRNDYYRVLKGMFDRSVTRDESGEVTAWRFSTLDLAPLEFTCASSYVVNRASVAKLHALCAAEAEAGPRLPFDLFLRRKFQERALRLGCIFPFVTSVRLERTLATTMEGRHDALSVLAANIARQSFFVACDWQRCLDHARRFLALPPQDAHRRLLLDILAFAISDRFHSY
jgi:hypothetical protein